MTKDRPRNRARGPGGTGGFKGVPGGEPWGRNPADGGRDAGEKAAGGGRDFDSAGDAAGPPASGEDKPWSGRAKPRSQRGGPPHGRRPERKTAAFEEDGEVWIWGLHAAGAALASKRRRVSRALVTRNAAHRLGFDADALPAYAELLDPKEIDRLLPADAVHQGVAVKAKPLDALDIDDVVLRPEKPLVILDQVTDPQNVGAVFRSAAAFGLGGVVLQTRHAPALGGSLAKAAAGAIESIEEIRAVNLSRAIETLTGAGWNVVGLDGSAAETLAEAFADQRPLAIVLGAEGAGLRPGVASTCTRLARIPIGTAMESLNVSNAAAIAFYEASRRRNAPPPKLQAAAAPREDADADETD